MATLLKKFTSVIWNNLAQTRENFQNYGVFTKQKKTIQKQSLPEDFCGILECNSVATSIDGPASSCFGYLFETDTKVCSISSTKWLKHFDSAPVAFKAQAEAQIVNLLLMNQILSMPAMLQTQSTKDGVNLTQKCWAVNMSDL